MMVEMLKCTVSRQIPATEMTVDNKKIVVQRIIVYPNNHPYPISFLNFENLTLLHLLFQYVQITIHMF